MHFRLLLPVVALCLTATLSAESFAEHEAVYQKSGRAVIDMANAKSVEVAKVSALVLTMEQQAVPMAQAYAKKFPAGKELIDAVIAQVATLDASGAVTALGPMKDMSFEVIEKQWHNMGYFKEHKIALDVSNEDNEHFTDPIHTIIHPMMVLRAAIDYQTSKSEKELKAMKEEMDEGLEQSEKTLRVLSK
jgi:hypothetical protein